MNERIVYIIALFSLLFSIIAIGCSSYIQISTSNSMFYLRDDGIIVLNDTSNKLLLGENDSTYYDFDNSGTTHLKKNVTIDNSTSIFGEFNFVYTPSYSRLGIGMTNPTSRIQLPNTFLPIGVGSGRAYSWTTYSDNRFKNFLGEIPEDKLISLYNIVTIQYYNPRNAVYNIDGSFSIGDTQTTIYNVGIDAQKLYQDIINSGFDRTFAESIVHKPLNDKNDMWSLNYDAVILILIEGARIKIEKIETFLIRFGYTS